ncbi:MAG TPA: response regulator transcription factor [Nitrospiraceae bacterium]|nr:response regulator transcription factor [Nitrospiraceae bacterium]
MNPLRILLAEDHTLVRAGIRALLESLEGVEVVAEAADGREALRLAEAHHPDILLMDITMKELNGLQAAARLTKEHSATRVIILSMHADQVYVRQALQAGAAGYLLKGADVAELELALKAVTRGDTYLSPSVSKDIVGNLLNGKTPAANPLDELTPRQREILQLVAEGRTTKEIAGRLDLSSKTVETHRAQLMERLDIHDVAGLVKFAIRVGLTQADK